ELGRGELSHADGSFHFLSVAPRRYTILAQRIGYAPTERLVTVVDGQTAEVVLEMTPSALEVAGVVVTGIGRERGASDTYRPTTVVGDAELRRRLEPSVAATIAHVPGISSAYNGPAATQPVIRGMGGDRVLILEDGQRTGDLATTGGDHAVTIDPITALRVEIVRGPAGLMYGSNALGGVINVVREEVPRALPETVSGGASVQVESVSEGIAAAGAVTVPHGRIAVRAEVSGRRAGDVRTPLGELSSSGVRSVNGSVGVSRIATWGYYGASLRDYQLDYGVPGEFQGELIPGAHPDGVEIRSRRTTGRVEAGHFLGFGPVSTVLFDANLVDYRHREIEGRIGDREFVGAQFENLFGSANLVVRHEHQVDPIFNEGALGGYFSGRQLDVGGGFTGSRDARAVSLAGFVYEELAVDPFRIQVGGRYDWARVTPLDRAPIFTGTREIEVRERSFSAVSASLGALFEAREGVFLGAILSRAFRMPSIEELFSDGPHLADYSYDIGSPDLDPEFGLGGDLFVRTTLPRLHAEVSVFRNRVANFIHHAPTGELDPRFHRFPLFEARGADAVFEGAEAGVQWEPLRRWVVDGSISYVSGTREGGDPLPGIPPLNGTLGLRYEQEAFFVTGHWESAAAQNRVPRPITINASQGATVLPERPTDGYNLLNLGGGIRWEVRGSLHTVTLQVDNVADAVRRDHLSRIKDVAPQPGRNVQLLYRVQF
ncbi:MAG TPA: TonB-dependent receptor, partial [Longimicrobiaceae bacterium]|nr:TonB-dependent receptor [Longimicrobiaceae bacterium]